MPFDPRLITPDDAPQDAHGELNLPDDLQELAAQLHDDALYLAARYPADAPRKTLVAAVQPDGASSREEKSRRWLLIGGSVAAALTVVVALAYRPPTPREVAQPTPVATAVASTTTDQQPYETPVSLPAERPAGPRIERLPWAPTPALGEVTGPELEGLLDLWQCDEQPGETRISI